MIDSTERTDLECKRAWWRIAYAASWGVLYTIMLATPASAGEAEKLVNLVQGGSTGQLAAYLATPGADINARPEVDKALLDYAAEQNQVAVATWLIDHGADVNGQEQGGRHLTPLHRAVLFDSFEVGRLLIARGAQVNANRGRGMTPLLYAASSGHARMVELLLQSGADPETGGSADQTPLSEAAKKGNLEIIKILESHGASLKHDRALSEAAMNQHPDTVSYLLDHDQFQDSKDEALRFAVIAANSRTETASLDMVSTLLAAGANVNNTFHGALNTPLMMANRAELRELLLAHGALDIAAVKAVRAGQAELRDILVMLGRPRQLDATLNIAAVREMRRISSANRSVEESAGWRHLKDMIALDLRYDVGPVLLTRADRITNRWQQEIDSGLGTSQGAVLMAFFKSDAGQRYLAFQTRLTSIEEDGIVAFATRGAGANSRAPAQPQHASPGELRLLPALDMLQWMATEGKGTIGADKIAEVAGPQLDALKLEYQPDLDAFSVFQQSAAAKAIAEADRRILEELSSAASGSMEMVTTAIKQSEQAHEMQWRQAYQTIRTPPHPPAVLLETRAPPPAMELPGCVKESQSPTRAVVTGFPGERIYISPKHPRECSDTGIDACSGTAYVLSGEEVQTLGACDEWTRVRYTGTRGTAEGWVSGRRLNSSDETATPPSFSESTPTQSERPDKSAKAGVCEEAFKGNVEDAGLRDVTRYSFPFGLMRSVYNNLPGDPAVIQEGQVDLFNEGQPQHVALLSTDYSARLDEFHAEWPVVLDTNSLPDLTIPVREKLLESAGINDHVRLFRFRGVTYMEHQPISDYADAHSEIWRFSRSEAIKVCD